MRALFGMRPVCNPVLLAVPLRLAVDTGRVNGRSITIGMFLGAYATFDFLEGRSDAGGLAVGRDEVVDDVLDEDSLALFEVSVHPAVATHNFPFSEGDKCRNAVRNVAARMPNSSSPMLTGGHSGHSGVSKKQQMRGNETQKQQKKRKRKKEHTREASRSSLSKMVLNVDLLKPLSIRACSSFSNLSESLSGP